MLYCIWHICFNKELSYSSSVTDTNQCSSLDIVEHPLNMFNIFHVLKRLQNIQTICIDLNISDRI